MRDSHFMEWTEEERSGCVHSYWIEDIVSRLWHSLSSPAYDTPFGFVDMFGGFRFDIAISSKAFERFHDENTWRRVERKEEMNYRVICKKVIHMHFEDQRGTQKKNRD